MVEMQSAATNMTKQHLIDLEIGSRRNTCKATYPTDAQFGWGELSQRKKRGAPAVEVADGYASRLVVQALINIAPKHGLDWNQLAPFVRRERRYHVEIH